jgi:hypothetical protein
LAWEHDVAPGFGAEPQEVINGQLGESWDIYLGLMHARFGSATQKFGSGTEEEFEHAYALWKAEPSKRRVMFYFKIASVDPYKVDLDQVAKVRRFREKVSNLGGLYKEFSDVEGFKDLWRAHLTSVLVELHSQHPGVAAAPQKESIEVADEVGVESPVGVLDLVETSVTGLHQLASILVDFARLASAATARAEEDNKVLGEASALGDLQGMRKGINSMSKSFLEFARGIADNRRKYSELSRRSFETVSRAVSMAKAARSEKPEDLSGFIDIISAVVGQIEEFVQLLFTTERQLEGMPNFAREFHSARLVLRREISSFRSELNVSISLLKDLITIAKS